MKNLVIETRKLIENITKIREKTTSRIIAVVKANGYGLSLEKFSKILIENGIDFLAVTDISDAVQIRDTVNSDVDILYMGAIKNEKEAKKVVDYGITAMVYDHFSAQILNKTAQDLEKSAKAHIKINSGMNRYGFDNADDVNSILEYKNIEFNGIFTHFYSSMNRESVDKQMFVFNSILSNIVDKKLDLVHVCNSFATLNYSDLHFDAVRVGSAFLGRAAGNYGLNKIAYIEADINAINILKKGQTVGYGARFKAKSDMKVAVLDVGTSDGFNVVKDYDVFTFVEILRSMYHKFKMLNKHIYVEINGKKCKVLGKIALNSTVVDITDVHCDLSDVAIISVNPLYVDSKIGRKYV